MNPSPESHRFLNTSSFPSLGKSSEELTSAVSMFVGKHGVPVEYRVDDGRSFELTQSMENVHQNINVRYTDGCDGSNEYKVNRGPETSSNRNNHAKTDHEFEQVASNSKVWVEGSTEVRTEQVTIEVIYLGEAKVKDDKIQEWQRLIYNDSCCWFIYLGSHLLNQNSFLDITIHSIHY